MQNIWTAFDVNKKGTFYKKKGTQSFTTFCQNHLIPGIQWSLLIYEISISHGSFLEKKNFKCVRKWLNIYSSTMDLSFYSSISPCLLPVKGPTSFLKSSKISGYLLRRNSKEPLVSLVSPNLNSGHLKAASATRITEAELNFWQQWSWEC